MSKAKELYLPICRSMMSRYAVYMVNLLSMMILARIFTPETFGTVASIMVFYSFFQLMTEAGLGPAIINLKKLDVADRNGLFGLTLVLGATLGMLFFFLAPVFLGFYQLPRVDEVVPYVAISIFFFAAAVVPSSVLLRDQAFFRIAGANLIAEAIATSATVALAQYIDPLHALSAKAVFNAAVNFFILYDRSKKTEFGRPAWSSDFSAIKPMLSFSLYQFGFNFINYFSRNLDNILIGKYMGAASLGIYDKAYQLMRYPLMLLTFAMTPAIQPVIRKHIHDVAKVEEIHRDFTFKLSLAGAAAGMGVYLLADLIVVIALGNQWSGVTSIIKILAIAIPAQVVLSTSGSFYQAMHRADLLFKCGLFSGTVTVSAIFWGIAQRDLTALAWALVVAFHINFIQAYCLIYLRIFKKNMSSFFLSMTPAALMTTGMAVYAAI